MTGGVGRDVGNVAALEDVALLVDHVGVANVVPTLGVHVEVLDGTHPGGSVGAAEVLAGGVVEEDGVDVVDVAGGGRAGVAGVPMGAGKGDVFEGGGGHCDLLESHDEG